MTTEFLSRLLLWSLAFNYAVLLTWFIVFVFSRHWFRNAHGKWFQMSDGTFDAIHYGGMAVYKIGILLFNVAPLVALYVIRSGS